MDVNEIWEEIISKPKWYAGILTSSGSFYTAQSARYLKESFKNGSLSESIIEKILNSHGYRLEKKWSLIAEQD